MYDNQICWNCIEESYVQGFIRNKGSFGKCSYCGKSRNVVPLEVVKEIILDGFEFLYDDPANGLGYEEGDYVQGNGGIFHTYDLLHDTIGFNSQQAFDDILSLLPIQLWCKKEFYDLDRAEEMLYTWESFAKQIKYKTRYFFIKEKSGSVNFSSYKRPYLILEEFTKTIIKLNLIDTLKKGSTIYRARKNHKNEMFNSAQQLGTPLPINCTRANRMSPAGFPCFMVH